MVALIQTMARCQSDMIVTSGGGAIWIGLHYWHNPDYWLVAIPGFRNRCRHYALAGATFIPLDPARGRRTREHPPGAGTLSDHRGTVSDGRPGGLLVHRRDDRARLLRITPWQGIQTYLDTLETSSSIGDGYHFDLPKDANRKLLVGQVFEVLPADGVPMTATFDGFTIFGEKHIGMNALQVPLGLPHNQSLAWFSVERTVTEWVEIYQQRSTGHPGDEGHAWVSVDDTFDDGVSTATNSCRADVHSKSPDLEGRSILDATGTTAWNTPQVRLRPAALKTAVLHL